MGHKPQLYTISASFPFVDSLVSGVTERYGEASDPLALSKVAILVPTRRAVRSLGDAFLRHAEQHGQGALLLPQVRPIGDVDEEELIAEGFPGQADPKIAMDLPATMPALRRQFILAQLIRRWRGRESGAHINPTPPNQAIRLAADLGRFIDTLITERIDPSRLSDIVPEQFSEHWREIISFLTIVSEHWPSILSEENAIDASERRNRLLEAQAERWRTAPPAGPVIAAGSTGSIPATADLLSVIARLKTGVIVLPGLDLDMDEAGWGSVDPSHPQYGMKELITRMGVDRDAVAQWPTGEDTKEAKPVHLRRHIIAETLRPAATTDRWRSSIKQFESQGWEKGLEGMSYIEAADPGEEATIIAIILREVLEESSEATGALVTPDRTLARRVAARLRRWGITIDDSAGTPLSQTPLGTFLRLIAEVARDNTSPISLLSLLKHPLCRCGYEPHEQKRLVENLEITCLRGPRPGEGLSGLRKACARGGHEITGLLDFLARLEAALGPLLDMPPSTSITLRDVVQAHIEAAESLSSMVERSGSVPKLWSENDGEAAATFFSDVLAEADHAPPLSSADYAALIDTLMPERVVRTRSGLHPRLFIWGPLEARLQRADVVVLSGLNEGTWPPQIDVGPWLSRQMRGQLGLSPPERRIGLAAHDFAQLTNAERVVLTRAERVDGTPTVASRWLMRLKTILRGARAQGLLQPTSPYAAWARRLDEPDDYTPLAPPMPRPPALIRPRQFSVTEIETWIRDPYSIYAKKILRLSPLKPLDNDPGPLERGILIHDILEKFVSQFPDQLPDNAYDELIAIGKSFFRRFTFAPAFHAFWWRKFVRIADGFIELERGLRTLGHPLGTEVTGSLELKGPSGPFILSARADRMDDVNGEFAVSDYKTGAVPSKKQVETFLVPQLPLEGLIAREGGFDGIKAVDATYLGYVCLSSVKPVEKIHITKEREATTELIGTAEAGLLRLIAKFDDPETPYLSRPRPMFITRASLYDHLARVKEWSVPGLNDAGDGS